MRRRLPLMVATATVGAIGLVGCSTGGSGGGAPGGGDASGADVTVVATTTILGDVAGQVATCAGGATVQTVIPVGADPHDFSPSSADVAAMVQADLVVANGLGLEEGLESALVSAQDDGALVLEVAPALDPLLFAGEHSPEEEGEEHAEEEGEDTHGSLDPHVGLDVSRMAQAAVLIGDQLTEATGDDAYAACGQEVSASLAETDEEVRTILAAVPAGSRILVTDHDAFGYFAEAYDFEVAGVVIPGGSTLAEPSSAEVSALVATIQETGVPAIFANTANPTALVDAVAAESGQEIAVVELYVDSLGPEGSGAETYQEAMVTNATRIADALAG